MRTHHCAIGDDKKLDCLASPLSSIRVLDLSSEFASLCGKIFGDLGADVIKVEKPGGDNARERGPFLHDIPSPETSLVWFAYHANKRGITINLESEDGRELFLQLARKADILIESFPPGYLKNLGLDYDRLKELNHRIIYVSITPFGNEGPYANFKYCDLVGWAMGGEAYMTGDEDRAPLRISVEQVYPQAGAQAAMGAMMALAHRELYDGEGQLVEVSMHECIVRTLITAMPLWEFQRFNVSRTGPYSRRYLTSQREIWHCKDGLICYRIMAGVYGHHTQRLVDFMASEGGAEELPQVHWDQIDLAKVSQEQIDTWERTMNEFFLSHTRAELEEAAIKWRFPLLKVSDSRDLFEDGHLQARGFWTQVEHPELGGKFLYPGAPVKTNRAGQWATRRRAPRIGEHNEEIFLGELGLSQERLRVLRKTGVI